MASGLCIAGNDGNSKVDYFQSKRLNVYFNIDGNKKLSVYGNTKKATIEISIYRLI